MDKVDDNKRYLEFSDMSWWQIQIDNFFNEILFELNDIPEGYIIEFGTFKCVSLNKLIKKYGEARCFGFDIINYINHPNVKETDVRKLNTDYDVPIAIAINDLGNWRTSPESRNAVLDFATRNIVSAGYYVDNRLAFIPADLISKKFTLIKEFEYHTLWNKNE